MGSRSELNEEEAKGLADAIIASDPAIFGISIVSNTGIPARVD